MFMKVAVLDRDFFQAQRVPGMESPLFQRLDGRSW